MINILIIRATRWRAAGKPKLDNAPTRREERKMNTYYHVAQNWDGNDLTSLYDQHGEQAYELYEAKWPESGNLGSYQVHQVHLYTSAAEAQKHAEIWGGEVLLVELDDQFDSECLSLDELEFAHPVSCEAISAACVSCYAG